jgi:hypothetical protein
MPVAGAVFGEEFTGFDKFFENILGHNIEDVSGLHCNNLTQAVKEICVGKFVSCAHEFLEEAW